VKIEDFDVGDIIENKINGERFIVVRRADDASPGVIAVRSTNFKTPDGWEIVYKAQYKETI